MVHTKQKQPRLFQMCCSCHLEGAVLRWAKLDAFIDESVEVALADVGGNFGPKLGGDDRTPH